MTKTPPRETDLYSPIKAFLEQQGYEVKSEIGAVDIVAIRGEEEPVLVELKLGFSLALVHQAIARLSISDTVYIVVERKTGRRFLKALKENKSLCRRLGIGLMTVRLRDGLVEAHLDPGPYAPRKSKRKTSALLREFARRRGDPNTGGATRKGLVTAYRQDALACAIHIRDHGVRRGMDVARATQIPNATRIMRENHYHWFFKVSKGVYDLSDKGRAAVQQIPSD